MRLATTSEDDTQRRNAKRKRVLHVVPGYQSYLVPRRSPEQACTRCRFVRSTWNKKHFKLAFAEIYYRTGTENVEQLTNCSSVPRYAYCIYRTIKAQQSSKPCELGTLVAIRASVVNVCHLHTTKAIDRRCNLRAAWTTQITRMRMLSNCVDSTVSIKNSFNFV